MVPEAIIKGPRAWTSAGQLAKRFGAAAINQYKRAGLITCWDHDRAGRKLRAPAWTLTDKGAHAYGVKVTEVPNANGLGVPFWSAGLDEHGRRKRGVRMATPRMIPEARGACKGQVVVDEEGKPLMVLGAEVRTDPRMGNHKVGKRHRQNGR
jgi:hypothetical protein